MMMARRLHTKVMLRHSSSPLFWGIAGCRIRFCARPLADSDSAQVAFVFEGCGWQFFYIAPRAPRGFLCVVLGSTFYTANSAIPGSASLAGYAAAQTADVMLLGRDARCVVMYVWCTFRRCWAEVLPCVCCARLRAEMLNSTMFVALSCAGPGGSGSRYLRFRWTRAPPRQLSAHWGRRAVAVWGAALLARWLRASMRLRVGSPDAEPRTLSAIGP